MKKKIFKVKQHDITDCGAACLASIGEFYDFKIPISRIRQMASTDQKGTNVLGMVEAAEKMGFVAKGVKGELDSLFKIPKPAIAHVVVKQTLHHYVVMYEVTKKYIKIMDPGDGRVHKKTHEEFKKEWTGVLILLLPGDNFQKVNEKTSIKRRFWNLVRPHKLNILQAFLGAVVFTLLGLSTSIYVQKIVDFVLVDGNKNLLNLLSFLVIIILIFRIFIGATKTLILVRTGQMIDAELILEYYRHLLRLPQRFFDTMRVGEIISRINDAVKIRVFINNTAVDLLVNILVILFSFALLFFYSWKMALLTLVIIPLYGMIYFITNKVNRKLERRVMENNAELESHLVESLNAMGTVKRFQLEDFADIKTEVRFVKLLKSIYKSSLTSLFSSNSSMLISSTFSIILLWVGAYLVIDRYLSPGELMSCYTIFGYLKGPIDGIIGMNKSLQNALIAADRLFEIMDLEHEEKGAKIKLTKDDLDDIYFKNVFFRYGTRKTVFEDLNLTIPKGKFTAIVGESGSGKTTLISLLQNIYLPEKGQIFIGNYQLKNISNESLRDLVSVVPQKIDLFNGSLAENIAIGNFEIDLKKINDICINLGLNKFIEELPDGFNTSLGENGANLSGGEKQRVAIARALYKEPEILILDEATSSLDSLSEKYVQNAMRMLIDEGKTFIVIAHRLSTVMKADRIIVMEKGKVIEEGDHEELFSKKGKYYDLWCQQMPLLVDKK